MEAKAKTRCTLSTTARHCRRRGRRKCPVSARKQKQTQNVDSEMARQNKQGTHSPCCELIECKYATRKFLFDATMPEHRRPATKTRKTKSRQSAGRRKALADTKASDARASDTHGHLTPGHLTQKMKVISHASRHRRCVDDAVTDACRF